MFAATKYLVVAVLLATFSAPAYAERRGGPGETWTDVEARSSDYYKIAFYGDETAVIVVVGDGDTDLDLYVYDENGNLVGSDTDETDYCVVRWTPRWTGVFRVEVRNLGYVYNHYYMRAN